jgi:hypothetical protein
MPITTPASSQPSSGAHTTYFRANKRHTEMESTPLQEAQNSVPCSMRKRLNSDGHYECNNRLEKKGSNTESVRCASVPPHSNANTV